MGVEKCQGCAYLNPIMFHCGKYLRGIETAVYLCDTAKPQTNADRIRAMTDEELAAKIEELCQYTLFQIKTYAKPNGREEWLNWLKQEAANDNHDH